MSLTLGEKLREAREERGFTLSEVAEQTRISSLYLESIENDDYRILPGGIFNKGFVKSYAKFVGINEQEALADYTALLAESEAGQTEEIKRYKPEVLTDDRSMGSMLPTVIVAVVILALMTIGILYGISYLQEPSEPAIANNNTKANTNSAVEAPSSTNTDQTPADVPDMATVKIEFKVLNQPVNIAAVTDGSKSNNTVTPSSPAAFEPKETFTVNYNKWNADKLQMAINNKPIALPAAPLNPRDARIEFTISKENLARIWTSGAISTEVPAAITDANANVPMPLANTANQAPAATPVRPIPSPRQNIPANTAPPKTPEPKPANTAKTPVKPPVNAL